MESNGRLYVLADPDIPWQGSRDVYGFPVLRTTRKFFASTGIKRIRGKDRRARAVPIPFGAARPPAILRCVGFPGFRALRSRPRRARSVSREPLLGRHLGRVGLERRYVLGQAANDRLSGDGSLGFGQVLTALRADLEHLTHFDSTEGEQPRRIAWERVQRAFQP